MSKKHPDNLFANVSFSVTNQRGRSITNAVIAMAVEEGNRELNAGTTRSTLTEEEKTFNYAMSAAGLLLLLIVIAIAKGLYELKYRRRRTTPTVPSTSRVTEAWSGGNKKTIVRHEESIKEKQMANKINTNGRLQPQPVFPPQPATLTIQDTEDDRCSSLSNSGNISTGNSRSVMTESTDDNVGNYLTSIESQLEGPSSSDSSRKSSVEDLSTIKPRSKRKDTSFQK